MAPFLIVKLLDFCIPDKYFNFWMSFIKKGSLKKRIQKSGIRPGKVNILIIIGIEDSKKKQAESAS